MDAAKAKKHTPDPLYFKYTAKDTIIYALSVGATPAADLHFVYENHENFQAFPTYVVGPGLMANGLGNWPGVSLDWTKVLHGEQFIEMFEPLPAGSGTLRAHAKVLDILDKGSGALIISEVTLYDDATNRKICVLQFGLFQVGAGNFGGAKTSSSERKGVSVPTNRPPDSVLEATVREDQAALYRQAGGDLNPLHIDPHFAKAAGFDRPIFHGLGTLGVATKKILAAYGANDAANFKALKARFSAPVVPGQTLLVEAWRDANRIHFQAKVKETGKIVLASAYMDLHKVGSASAGAPSAGQSAVKSAEIFEKIGEELTANKALIAKINSIIVYDITVGGKPAASYTLDLKNEPYSVYGGKPKNGEKAAVSLTVDDEDFLQLAGGKLDGIKNGNDGGTVCTEDTVCPESKQESRAIKFLLCFLVPHFLHQQQQQHKANNN